MTERIKSPGDHRQDRLRAALRDNLRRRKVQAKARAAGEANPERADPAHDSARIGAEKRDL